MKNDIWYKQNKSIITPFIDHSVKKRENGQKVCSYGLSPTGYDIRLSKVLGNVVLMSEERYDLLTLDPKEKNDKYFAELEVFENERGEYVELEPSCHYLACSVERVKMPRNVSGFLLVKSTYARLGVGVINPLIDAGFEGELTVSLVNHSFNKIRLYLNEGFAQFVSFETGECETDYGEKGGRFQNSEGVTING